MNCGALLFQQKVPFIVEMEGDVNGEIFSVRGNGFGNATTGKLDILFVCTTGEIPVAWESLISSLAYGAFVFAKYPSNIADFFKSTMPEGYIQERKVTFENDGTYETHATVTYENGAIFERVKLTGTGFREDGNILGKKLEITSLGTPLSIMADDEGKGLRSVFNQAIKVVGGNRQIAIHEQRNRPIGDGLISVPDYHTLHNHLKCSKVSTEKRDHMMVNETLKAIDCQTAYL
uniref:Non-fluorescent photochromic chromoprotein FP4 n=1 Tax=Aequorea australis TaxID=1246302 RepID=A0A5J6CYV7_9CNID|nr:non-fluorescent photochromic chromoprotein FP4 [Aequorea australis]